MDRYSFFCSKKGENKHDYIKHVVLLFHLGRLKFYKIKTRFLAFWLTFDFKSQILVLFEFSGFMGPKPHPTPKPHARSVIAKITKVIEAKPKPIPIRPPPPRSLRTVSGIIQPSSSSTSRTQVRSPLSEGPTQCESGDQAEFSIDFDTLEVPACLKFPVVGQILPADPAPLKDKTDAERLTQNQRILDLLKEFSDISSVAGTIKVPRSSYATFDTEY